MDERERGQSRAQLDRRQRRRCGLDRASLYARPAQSASPCVVPEVYGSSRKDLTLVACIVSHSARLGKEGVSFGRPPLLLPSHSHRPRCPCAARLLSSTDDPAPAGRLCRFCLVQMLPTDSFASSSASSYLFLLAPLPPTNLNRYSSRKYYQPLSLRTLQEYIDLKRIDASEPITVEHIDKSNMVRGWKSANGFKLLARGVSPPSIVSFGRNRSVRALSLALTDGSSSLFDPARQFENLKQPIHIFPHRASSAAIKAIEAAGGSVTCVYHNRISFRQAIMPERFLGHRRVRDAFPMKKRDILYYTNWSVRRLTGTRPMCPSRS